MEVSRGSSSRSAGRSRTATLAFLAGTVALSSLPRVVGAAFEDYPYIGCYNDQRSRVMGRQMQPVPLTLESCAMACLKDQAEGEEWKFAGLQYGQECFCGNSYSEYGEAENCDMTLQSQPSVKAGGTWKMSIYDLQEAIALNSISSSSYTYATSSTGSTAGARGSPSSSSSSSSAPEEIGGDTPVDTYSPVESGKRAFTVVNKCSQKLRVGSTGGRITFLDSDATSEEACDAWGASATYNPGPMGIGCYWTLPEEEGGNVKRELEPGEYARFNLAATEGDTRWSGTIWASTGCDDIDGCATGVCYSPSTDYVCPPYVGPGGPTTKAEFTLSDGGKDYYDISLIDGVNLPMMIEPDNPVYPDSATTNHAQYRCGSPGAMESPTGLGGCTWAFEDQIKGIDKSISQFLRLVLPADYESPIECESDTDCSGDTCGVHPQRWADGSYKGGVEQGSCGDHVAWVSAGGACAGGWSSGEFPDDFPFYCGTPVTNGQIANMYGCNAGALAHSGYTPGADDTACGCPDWEAEDISAPAISDCVGINPEWTLWAQPWAQYLKKGCPTAYTFPYDDQTSTFDCVDGDESDPNFVNTQSYTITFCHDDTEAAMYP